MAGKLGFVQRVVAALGLAAAVGWIAVPAAEAQCPAGVPVAGAALPAPLPLFPPDNWWNQDVSAAPVDAGSANYIAFINNGGTRRLHPDFGGEASPGSIDIYGMPYAIVDGTQPKLSVIFDFSDESDGVNHATNAPLPFYPIPAQAITQPHWIEGGAPGSVDQRSGADRHLFVIDCTNRYLYELYNVWYDAAHAQWYGGSGAFFDLNANNRRPDGWTSADAAGLAIFPGLVRYDEAWNPAVTDIGHAFRVTVRSTNGYVYPASHRAGSTTGALPMGARLRLKTLVGGLDPALRTTDANARKIFRAMQKYGLIVADNGSDLYITGTFDTRWNNSVLNPAFATLTAGDFEVVQLGWKPAIVTAALTSLAASPSSVTAGNAATGTVTLTSAAPAGGVVVALGSASTAVVVPASVSVAAGATSASFAIATNPVTITTATTLSATYGGATRTTTFTVNPAPPVTIAALTVLPSNIPGGTTAVGTVRLSAPAPAGGITIALSSSYPALATVPAGVVVAGGTTTATFGVKTAAPKKNTAATIAAVYNGRSGKILVKVLAP